MQHVHTRDATVHAVMSNCLSNPLDGNILESAFNTMMRVYTFPPSFMERVKVEEEQLSLTVFS